MSDEIIYIVHILITLGNKISCLKYIIKVYKNGMVLIRGYSNKTAIWHNIKYNIGIKQ